MRSYKLIKQKYIKIIIIFCRYHNQEVSNQSLQNFESKKFMVLIHFLVKISLEYYLMNNVSITTNILKIFTK